MCASYCALSWYDGIAQWLQRAGRRIKWVIFALFRRIRHHQRLKLSWCPRSRVRNTVFKWSYWCVNSNSNRLPLVAWCRTAVLTSPNQRSWGRMKYSSPSCPFWRYKRWTVVCLARTLERYTFPTSPTRSHHPSNMTFVSNDPSLWPYIDSQVSYNYWMGLSCQLVVSRSNIDLHFAVAAGIVVVYDWGEQDVVLMLLPFLW
jgi:hypothetical protein